MLFDFKPVEEVCTSKDVDYLSLKIFYFKAYAHIHNDERNKLESKSLEHIFLRFDKEVKEFMLYDLANKKVDLSTDIVFDKAFIFKDEVKKGDGKEAIVIEDPTLNIESVDSGKEDEKQQRGS
ncbi:hypothetical protein Pint_07537 [Pistacia integerrima]|uniref:Uncharacterized protein n=1 Tax=Pistacia integerrima TaxID=434235 RepID=A0ACC0Y0G8_9ROSI|nr:hypothetical protein Pint_07537 [Pistacia integerrima]